MGTRESLKLRKENKMARPTRLMILIVSVFCTTVMAAPPDAKPRLGINLAGPADWATELPFVDVFRTSRPWISQRKGAGWGQGPELAIDEFGWVKQLQPDCYAESMLCTISDGHYPSGVYTVIYEGDGEIEFGKGPRIVDAAPGRIRIDVASRSKSRKRTRKTTSATSTSSCRDSRTPGSRIRSTPPS